MTALDSFGDTRYVRYHVFAGGHFDGQHRSLVGACTDARSAAITRAGVLFEVKRIDGSDSVLEATYQVGRTGALKAWMR